jgi:hypothetical protein
MANFLSRCTVHAVCVLDVHESPLKSGRPGSEICGMCTFSGVDIAGTEQSRRGWRWRGQLLLELHRLAHVRVRREEDWRISFARAEFLQEQAWYRRYVSLYLDLYLLRIGKKMTGRWCNSLPWSSSSFSHLELSCSLKNVSNFSVHRGVHS